MPLPPAPSKRAALLSPEAYDAPARTSHKAARKTEAHPAARTAAEKPQAGLDLEPHAGGLGLETAVARESDSFDDIEVLEDIAEPVTAKKRPATPPVQHHVQPAAKARKPRPSGPSKLFVLDTNVLMHDPMSLYRFEEHDIFLPMIVLEELDGHKKGMTEVARNARQASRSLDALAGAQGADITGGLKLNSTGHPEAGGCLFFQTTPLDNQLPLSLPQGKADNQILGVVHALRQQFAPREVVLEIGRAHV